MMDEGKGSSERREGHGTRGEEGGTGGGRREEGGRERRKRKREEGERGGGGGGRTSLVPPLRLLPHLRGREAGAIAHARRRRRQPARQQTLTVVEAFGLAALQKARAPPEAAGRQGQLALSDNSAMICSLWYGVGEGGQC